LKISKEVKTGALALTAIVLFIFGYNFMKGHNILDSSKEIYAIYDNVEGLSGSADVVINGLKIGKVTETEFLDESGKILVTMRIKSDFKFSNRSIAQIYNDGLIGGKVMKILPEYVGENIKSGDTLNSDVDEGIMASVMSRLVPLREKVESAVGGVDSLVQSLNNVLDDKGQANIKESLAKLNTTLENLNSSSSQIDGMLSRNAQKIDNTIHNFDHTAENLSNLSDSLAKIEVQPVLNKVNLILDDFNELSQKLKDGEGTAGKLLTDENLYDNLDRASKQMEELIQDIKLNPKRYIHLRFSVFGGKNKTPAYKKPEDPLQ